MAEYAAFCSTNYPSIAYRQDGKRQRTKLSIFRAAASSNAYRLPCFNLERGQRDAKKPDRLWSRHPRKLSMAALRYRNEKPDGRT